MKLPKSSRPSRIDQRAFIVAAEKWTLAGLAALAVMGLVSVLGFILFGPMAVPVTASAAALAVAKGLSLLGL